MFARAIIHFIIKYWNYYTNKNKKWSCDWNSELLPTENNICCSDFF